MGDPRKFCSEKCPRRSLDIGSPRLKGRGARNARIVLVGEAPGQLEDLKGKPFIGNSGQLLNDVLEEAGISHKDVYITNAVKCATPVDNKKPGKKEITACRNYLIKEISKIRPNVVGCVGAIALEAVLKRGGITKLQNNVFYSDELKVKVVPVLHPAYILRNPAAYDQLLKGFKIIKNEAESKEKATVDTTKTKRIDATSPEKIDKILDKLEKVDAFAFDLETTSLNPRLAKIICIALSWKVGLGVTIKWDKLSTSQSDRLQQILLSKKTKIGQNLKYDIQVLRANGVRIKGPYFDTLPASALLDSTMKQKGLDALTLRYLDMGEYWAPLDAYKAAYIKEHKIKADDFNYSMFPWNVLCPYAQGDADATYRLYELFKKGLIEQKLSDFYNKYTLPTLVMLIRTETKGIRIHRKRLKRLIEKYKIKIDKSEKAIHKLPSVKKYQKIRFAKASRKLAEKWENSKTLRSKCTKNEYIKKRLKPKEWKFNSNSPKQLRELLFDMLKLPILKTTDTKQASTDAEVLTTLAESSGVPIAQKIITNRKITKFYSTYLVSVYNKSALDGRIHPNYSQSTAVTGRLACSDPNFQNIPRDAKAFKKCFLADPGMVIVKADLAQAEFRCWAHYANDQKLIKDIEGGLDIHRKIASEVFNVPEDEVTKDQRTAAKNAVFGLMYGRGTKDIARQYGISIDDAEEIKTLFFHSYPVAALWLDKTVAFARQHQYVRTWLGRISRLPEIISDDHMIRAEAERCAKNYPIQGLASDMNNHLMVQNLKRAKKAKIHCYPMGTIHDANYIQVKEDQAEKLKKIMDDVVHTAFPTFRCRMDLDFEIGKTLGSVEEV
jgi:DNA polymerase I